MKLAIAPLTMQRQQSLSERPCRIALPLAGSQFVNPRLRHAECLSQPGLCHAAADDFVDDVLPVHARDYNGNPLSLSSGKPLHDSGSIQPSYKGDPAVTIGDRIRLARKLRGLTQTELAKRSGTAQGTISDMENGRQRSSAALVEIAHALKVRPMWLADGSGAMDAKPGENSRDEALQRLLDAWELLTPEQRELFAKMVQSVAD